MEINEREIGLKFLKSRVIQLENELLALRNTIKAIENRGDSSITNSVDNTSDYKGTRKTELFTEKVTTINKELEDATLAQKFLLVLKEHQRFMRVREIGEYIDSQIGGGADEWVTKLSRRTKKLKDLNKIVKYQLGSSRMNVFWGSPSWLDNDGNIKTGFEYDSNATANKKGDDLISFDL